MSNQVDTPLPLLTYADELVEKLRELLPAAIREHHQTSIHHARVATRRLKAAAEVFEPVSSRAHRQDFVKTLKKLRQHLGPARDLDVMISHLEEIKSDRLKPGVDWLLAQFSAQREDLRESEAESFDVAKALARLGAWWGVRQDWAEARDGLDCLIGESLHLQLDRFIEHADAVSRRGAMDANSQMLDPHQLRIAGKALRYSLDMAVAGGHRLPAVVGRAFKRMQDALGLWHDFVGLCDTILQLSVEKQIGHSDPATAAVVLEIARLVVKRSAQQLARFNKLWNSKGEMLAATIRRAFPLNEAEAVTELKTDPDPVGSEPPAGNPAAAPTEPSAV